MNVGDRWLLAAMSLGLAACGPSDADFVEFDTFTSPDNTYRVTIESAPARSLSFSPEDVRFYAVGPGNDERVLIGTTRLSNDGSRLTDRNIRAEWVGAGALEACLAGSEQDDEIVIVDLVAMSFSTESAACAD